jgi:hypothetical protein
MAALLRAALLLAACACADADEPEAAAEVLPPAGECRCSAHDAEAGMDRAGSDIKAYNSGEVR